MIVLAWATATYAQELQTQVSSREAYVGESVTIGFTVQNAPDNAMPTIPQTQDFEIRYSGAPNKSTSVSIVNGRMTQTVTTTFVYEATPLHVGDLPLPAFTINLNGQTYRSARLSIKATKMPPGPLVSCEIKANVQTVFVGQELPLKLEIWAKRVQQGNFTADPQQTLRWLNPRPAVAGVFDGIDFSRWGYRAERRADEEGVLQDYYVYFQDVTIRPAKMGPLDCGGVEFAVSYPLRVGQRRDPFAMDMFDFGGIAPTRFLNMRLKATTPNVAVKTVPTEDRPPDYNGAIGHYSIQAAAKPASVPVGDPITLTLTIGGQGSLDGLRAPKLEQVEALSQAFEVPTGTLAGEVQGNTKVFTQTIRPLHEGSIEIPRIPFTSFDPATEKFETTWSQPIPITVTPAEKVTLTDMGESGAKSAPGGTTTLVETSGLLANYSDPDAVLANQTVTLTAGHGVAMAGLPLFYAAVWIFQRRQTKLAGDEALRRRSRAYSSARKALKQAESENSLGQVSTALLGYIADRCNVPAGGLTRGEAVELLQQRRAPAGAVANADDVLAALEQAQYGGGAGTEVNGLMTRVRGLVDELERCKLR